MTITHGIPIVHQRSSSASSTNSSSGSSGTNNEYDFAKSSFKDSAISNFNLLHSSGSFSRRNSIESLPERVFMSGSTSRFSVQSLTCTPWISPKALHEHVIENETKKQNSQPISPRNFQGLFPFDPMDIIAVDCGYNVTFYQTKYGLYASGSNSVGELGLGHTNDVKDKVEQVKLPVLPLTPTYYIKKIASGEGHTVVLMSTGEIIVFGKNGDGQLGLEKSVGEPLPKLIPSSTFGGDKVVQVSCGYYHTLVLTESGVVYGTGRNIQNQIGCVPNHVNVSSGFRPVTVLKEGGLCNDGGKGLKIVKIACGSHHSLFLTEDGILYAAGDNQFNALAKKYPVFSPLEPFYSNGTGIVERVNISNEMSFKNVTKAKPYKFVTNVWCGSLSTFVQTKEDKVFVCGTANDRALFLDETTTHGSSNFTTDGFVLCDLLSGKGIVDIVGFYSMVAVSKTRDVYICGNNSSKQLTSKDQPIYNLKPQFEPFISEKLKQYPLLDYNVTAGFRTCSFYIYSMTRRTRNEIEFFSNLYFFTYQPYEMIDEEEQDNNFFDLDIIITDDDNNTSMSDCKMLACSNP
ncbi:hypothetical protein ABK040_001762 [Willaertia magna]